MGPGPQRSLSAGAVRSTSSIANQTDFEIVGRIPIGPAVFLPKRPGYRSDCSSRAISLLCRAMTFVGVPVPGFWREALNSDGRSTGEPVWGTWAE